MSGARLEIRSQKSGRVYSRRIQMGVARIIDAKIIMATAEVQDDAQHKALDAILRPHLRLELPQEESGKKASCPAERLEDIGVRFKKPGQQQKLGRATVLQSTIETDNKRRPGILKRNSTRYKPPSPEPPDPNSEAKSAVIRHMQENLLDWDQQLQAIAEKKKRNDDIQRSELAKRDESIKNLTEKLNHECAVRVQTQEERDAIQHQLTSAEEDLENHRVEIQNLQAELMHCQMAYEQTEARRMELEEQNVELLDKLEQIESMKKRLNDLVTELQGQLAIVEQRSRFCSIS